VRNHLVLRRESRREFSSAAGTDKAARQQAMANSRWAPVVDNFGARTRRFSRRRQVSSALVLFRITYPADRWGASRPFEKNKRFSELEASGEETIRTRNRGIGESVVSDISGGEDLIMSTNSRYARRCRPLSDGLNDCSSQLRRARCFGPRTPAKTRNTQGRAKLWREGHPLQLIGAGDVMRVEL